MITIAASDVLSRFEMLSGVEDAEAYQALCSDAAEAVGGSQRASCGEESRAALTAAATALAFYRFTLARCGTGAESFSAGDVKVVKSAGDAASAWNLWRGAAATAAPFLTDGGCFLFGRIRP